MQPWHVSLIGWILIILLGVGAMEYLTWAEAREWTRIEMALGLGPFYLALALTPWLVAATLGRYIRL